jgi:hypothetical protein
LSLESFDISGNHIGPEGARAIAAAVSGTGASASQLTYLGISQNEIGDEGVAAMVQAGLGRNTSLTHLDVGDNGLRYAGCMALARWAEARFFPLQDVPAHRTRSRAAAAAAVGAASLSPDWPVSSVPPPKLSARAVPLTVNFDTGDEDGFDHELSTAVEASINRIVNRVNAAADAAGWRRKELGQALHFDI